MFKAGVSKFGVYTFLNVGIAFALLTGLFWLHLVVMTEVRAESIRLYFVALGALAAGGLLGFVFGADGEEKKTLTPLAGVINGLIGGFALADLGKQESVIKKIIRTVALDSGLQGIGFISCVISFFGILGFLGMFANKRYFLNPAAQKLEKLGFEYEKIAELTGSIHMSLTEIGMEVDPALDKEAISQALSIFETASRDKELIRSIPIDTLKSYAKGYYALAGMVPEKKRQYLQRAEDVLRIAREKSPDDGDVIFCLSYVLLIEEKYSDAIPYLTYLTTTAAVRVLTYKMLGFAYLWDPAYLDESERATTKYLAINPNDAGAKLNLACALGQKGPIDPINRNRVLELLSEVLALNPELRLLVIPKLIARDGDFYLWKELPEFIRLFPAATNNEETGAGQTSPTPETRS